MKVTNALLVALLVSTTAAVKIERRAQQEDDLTQAERDLRYKGKTGGGGGGKKGKNADDSLFDPVCLDLCQDTCQAQCALPDCIPLDASAAPSEAAKSGKGKNGKGKNGESKSGKGKNGNDRFGGKGKGKSGSEAPSYFCSEAPSDAPSMAFSIPPSSSPSDTPSSSPSLIECEFFVDQGPYESQALAAAAVTQGTAGIGSQPAGSVCGLASITSPSEQAAVEALLPPSGMLNQFYWLGGFLIPGAIPGEQCGTGTALPPTDLEMMGQTAICAERWGWFDMSDWTYQNWTPAFNTADPQPENTPGFETQTAVIIRTNAGAYGTWADVQPSQSNIQPVGAVYKCCLTTD